MEEPARGLLSLRRAGWVPMWGVGVDGWWAFTSEDWRWIERQWVSAGGRVAYVVDHTWVTYTKIR